MKPVSTLTPTAEITVGPSSLDPVVWMVAQTKHASILTDLTPEQAMTLADALERAASEASKEKTT
jgi:hypothetical protein